jgi:large subunit ribosomal protein L33
MLPRLSWVSFRAPFSVVPKGAAGSGAAGFSNPPLAAGESVRADRPIRRVRSTVQVKSPDQRLQIKSWVNRPGKPFSKAVMAKGNKRLEIIHLVCQETGDQNYTLRRKSGGEKLKLKKYSPRLRRHTVHVEKKK